MVLSVPSLLVLHPINLLINLLMNVLNNSVSIFALCIYKEPSKVGVLLCSGYFSDGFGEDHAVTRTR